MSNFGNKLKKAFTINEMLDNINYLTEKNQNYPSLLAPPMRTEENWLTRIQKIKKAIAFDICYLARKLLHTEAEPPQYYKNVY